MKYLLVFTLCLAAYAGFEGASMPSPSRVVGSDQNALPSPTPDRAVHDFNVQGVRLGDAERTVAVKLGKPLGSRQVKVDRCGITAIRRLTYPGLVIELDEGTDKVWSVLEMHVSSPQVDVGVQARIGSPLPDIEAALGKAFIRGVGDDKVGYYYTPAEDNAEFDYRNGKLAKIRLHINPC